MPDQAELLLAEQIALEREQIRKGLDKLQSNTRKLEQKDYASASEYGTYGIQANVSPKPLDWNTIGTVLFRIG